MGNKRSANPKRTTPTDEERAARKALIDNLLVEHRMRVEAEHDPDPDAASRLANLKQERARHYAILDAQRASTLLETAINATPTSKARELLTQANIFLSYAIDALQGKEVPAPTPAPTT